MSILDESRSRICFKICYTTLAMKPPTSGPTLGLVVRAPIQSVPSELEDISGPLQL
jgi:hypothetical protein